MKYVYRITEKFLPVARKSKILSETFFTSRKKAVDYLHKKFEALPAGTCLKYKKGELLRASLALQDPPWSAYDTVRYVLDVVPVN